MPTSTTRAGLARLSALLAGQAGAGRWLVLTHDNPDPDSIASAALLAHLLRDRFHRRVTVGYGGLVGRAENREMVRVLDIRMSHRRNLVWRNYRHIALVDTQPRTGNNSLPDEIRPDLVFDHHPERPATRRTSMADIRTQYGATATIVGEYCEASGLVLNRRDATALVYAIRSETQDFRREYCPRDRELYDRMLPLADNRALGKIQSPPLPLSYFRTLHRAVEGLEGVANLIASHLGPVEQPDIVPEIADLLLRLEGRTWSLATGRFDGRLYLSIRTTNPRADAGHLMRRLIGRRGKGGGHGMTAGGWIDPGRGAPGSLERELGEKLAKALKKDPAKLAAVSL